MWPRERRYYDTLQRNNYLADTSRRLAADDRLLDGECLLLLLLLRHRFRGAAGSNSTGNNGARKSAERRAPLGLQKRKPSEKTYENSYNRKTIGFND